MIPDILEGKDSGVRSLKYCLGIGLILVMVLPVGVEADLTPGVTANYGEFTGSTVLYSNVVESTDFGYYGAPTVGGNALSFVPTGLKAESIGGMHPMYNIPIPTVNDAQLNFHVWAQDGHYLEALEFSEGGDLTLAGTGTSNTYVDVTANFFVKIYKVDGVSINTITTTNTINNFTPNADGTVDLSTDGSVSGMIWDGSIYIDLEQILKDEGISYSLGVTHASVNLDNWLEADSEAGTYSSIQKKDAEAFTVTAIPEPASLVLIMGTTSLFIFLRRRFIG